MISEIRNYAASPGDTLVQTLEAGQWVVVLGQNLGDVSQVYFGSVPATINQTLLISQKHCGTGANNTVTIMVPALSTTAILLKAPAASYVTLV